MNGQMISSKSAMGGHLIFIVNNFNFQQLGQGPIHKTWLNRWKCGQLFKRHDYEKQKLHS
jgi:hypothetical protein